MGVVRTRVGYAGGQKDNPTYRSLGDHIETIQFDYDPDVVSYEKLLAIFWRSHNPTRQPWSRQYMSAIFFHSDQQKELAIATRNRESDGRNSTIHTEIIPYVRFYLAEDYHQKYALRQTPTLINEFSDMYPDMADFVASTAVARANGYVSGYGRIETLQSEIDDYGLSPTGKVKLLEIAHRYSR